MRGKFNFFSERIMGASINTLAVKNVGVGLVSFALFRAAKQRGQFEQRNRHDATNPYLCLSAKNLMKLLQPKEERYPFVDQSQRAQIFADFFAGVADNLSAQEKGALLDQAVETNQFIAINALVKHDGVISGELVDYLVSHLEAISYELISLHAQGKLAAAFEHIFFTNNHDVKAPRLFMDGASISQEVERYIQATERCDQGGEAVRKLYFFNGGSEYDWTILPASIENNKLFLRPETVPARYFSQELAHPLSALKNVVGVEVVALEQENQSFHLR